MLFWIGVALAAVAALGIVAFFIVLIKLPDTPKKLGNGIYPIIIGLIVIGLAAIFLLFYGGTKGF